MNVTCSAEGCPVLLNGICVFYEGTTLLYTGITTNDNLQTALQKIDAKFADAAIGYAFNNGLIQYAPGQPVQLGGSLIQDTTITGNYKLAFAGRLEASELITTGGTSTDFVKGDGSLDPTSYQPAGNYITNLTGDVLASGPGSVAATLATVFNSPGTYGNSGSIPRITVDSKGRITNVTPTPINYPAQSLSFVGDVDGSGYTGSPVTLTLDTVNTDVYGSNNFLKFAVNGKGLITSATPVSGGDITTALGYVPVDNAIQLTINGTAHDLSANRSWSVGTVTTVGVTAGTGISASVSNPTTNPTISITNTAPDQIVVLNGGTGISISGSYPNFTITNDYPSLGGTVTNFSAGNLSPLFTTSVSNSSTTPALSFALSSAAANTVLAGPNGGAGTPTYRALVAADIPSLSYISSISVTSPLASTGGLTPTLSISQADSSTNGYLSSVDWTTFNSKQPAGNYITALTGDATASGPGSACLTFNTVNATTGTFGSSTQVPVITVNGKGLVTCVTTSNISGSLEFVGDVIGVGSTGTCTTLTLATVNNDVYTSETLLNIAVNGKGLITSANPTTAGDICSTLGYTPEDVANKSTCTALGTSNTLYPTQLAVKTYVDNATSGGIILQGDWNAATNTPNISGTTTTGWAWRVSVAGTTNLGGITDWQVGDLAVKSATGWVKIDNSDGVTSVFGRFGAIVATTGDYLSCQVTECGNLYYTDARVRAAVGHTAPLTYNSTTGVFGISQSNCTTDGYLSATDWNTFNDKQPALGYTPVNQTRQLTINGTTYDLSADRTWNVGTVTSVTGSAPLASSGGTAPNLTISQSGTASDGYLSSIDWNHFNSHTSCTGTVTNVATCTSTTGVLLSGSPVTTTGTLGIDIATASTICTGLLTAADWNTFNSHTGCTGTVTSVGLTSSTTGVTIGSSPVTTSGNITLDISTASSTCTGLLSSSDWNTFNSHTGCTGTVTCVDAIGTNISVTGGPITSSGTLNISLSGANVCSALGYTPYNATNPSGYTTCVGTVTSVGIIATNINVCNSPVTTSGNICLNLTAANVCAALGYSPSTAPTIFVNGIGTCSVLRCGVSNGASGDYTASLGGQSNLVSGCYSTIVGGQCNNITERRGVIVGGLFNTVSSYGGAVFTGVCNISCGTSASVVIGGSFNTASGYLSITGGGNRNTSSAAYSAVFGGQCNTASGGKSFVGGGQSNQAQGLNSFVGGGNCNNVCNSTSGCLAYGAVVVGGVGNNTTGGTWSLASCAFTLAPTVCNAGRMSFVGSGFQNRATGNCAAIPGGQQNTASGAYSSIGGGKSNTSSAYYSVVAGGVFNVACFSNAFVGGGKRNCATQNSSTVSGGYFNFASGGWDTIGGGRRNCTSGTYSTISGGYCNVASATVGAIGGGCLNTASGAYTNIGGGVSNTASGCFSAILGGNCNSSTTCWTTVGGGFKNTAQAFNSFIGGGNCNNVCNSTSGCLAYGAVVVGGVGNNTTGGTWNLASCAFTVAPTICNAGAYSFIGGGFQNRATGNYSTVAGGCGNTTSNNYSVIVGGKNNSVSNACSGILGGWLNSVSGAYSAISGGRQNTVTGGGSFIGGGQSNTANASFYATIGGGLSNTASGYVSFIGGGGYNIASCNYSAVLGGISNKACGLNSSVVGGNSNTASGRQSFVGAGFNNTASAYNSFVGAGYLNSVSGCYSALVSGYFNTANGNYSFVGGGKQNLASCDYSIVSGGICNRACSTTAFIGGGQCNLISQYSSTIGGGFCNNTSGASSFIGGGTCNNICCVNIYYTSIPCGSTISGGYSSTTFSNFSTISGGFANKVGCTLSAYYAGLAQQCTVGIGSTISGGINNWSIGDNSGVGSGSGNVAGCLTWSGYYSWLGPSIYWNHKGKYSFIGGGCQNTILSDFSFIGGGYLNCANGLLSTVAGGCFNKATSSFSFVGGGNCNAAYSGGSFVGGGFCNTASSYYTAIVGGLFNTVSGNRSFAGGGQSSTVSGNYAASLGGRDNIASGNFSAALGGSTNTASAVWSGVFGCNVNNNIACSFASNQLWACNLVGTSVAVCVGTNGLLVRGASDCRLKTNICDISYGLCDVNKLRPVSFDWNEQERDRRGCNRQVGFIAQEVEPIIPEAVGQQADNGEYSLSPDKLIPILTKGIQELSEENVSLRARLEAIEQHLNLK